MTTPEHAEAIDAARLASENLLASELTGDQRQWVVDLMNAMQWLNTLYWEYIHVLHGRAVLEKVAQAVYEIDHYYGTPWDEAQDLEKMLYRDRAGVTLSALRLAIS